VLCGTFLGPWACDTGTRGVRGRREGARVSACDTEKNPCGGHCLRHAYLRVGVAAIGQGRHDQVANLPRSELEVFYPLSNEPQTYCVRALENAETGAMESSKMTADSNARARWDALR